MARPNRRKKVNNFQALVPANTLRPIRRRIADVVCCGPSYGHRDVAFPQQRAGILNFSGTSVVNFA